MQSLQIIHQGQNDRFDRKKTWAPNEALGLKFASRGQSIFSLGKVPIEIPPDQPPARSTIG